MPDETASVQRSIGRLEGRFDMLARANDDSHKIVAAKLDKLAARLDDMPTLALDVARMKPEVEHYTRMRNRAWGIGAGLILGGGAAGQWIGKLIGKAIGSDA